MAVPALKGKTGVVEQSRVTSAAQDPEAKGRAITAQADLSTEYVSGAGRDWWRPLTEQVRALPASIDDITRDFGADIYERMMNDPQVSSVVDILRMSALDEGIKLAIPDDVPDEEADKEEAQRILDFCQHCLDNLRHPLMEVLYELTEGVYLGHKVAEQIYEVKTVTPEAGPQLPLVDLKCKPRASTAFVVDDKNNEVGLLNLKGNRSIYGVQVIAPTDNAGEIQDLIPRAKFAVFTYMPRNNDPRGTSILRAVYTQWWMKQQLQPEYLAYLSVYAQPSVKGIMAEGTPEFVEERDTTTGQPTGNMIRPSDRMAESLAAIRNGGYMVLPYGADAEFLQVQGEGEVFTQAFNWFDKQIAKGVTKQTLATEEAEHMARAASTTHQDVLAMPVDRITATVHYTLREDVLRPLVLYNYGEEASRKYTPQVVSAAVEKQDLGTASQAYAVLRKEGLLHDDQRPHVWNELGLPPVDQAVLEQDALRKKALTSQLASTPPPEGGDDQGEDGEEEGEEEGQAPPKGQVPPQLRARGNSR